MNNQYLFIEIALETTVASGASTAAMVLRVGNVSPSISTIVTTAFVGTAVPASSNVTICAVAKCPFSVNNDGSIVALLDALASTGAFSNSLDIEFQPDTINVSGSLIFLYYAGEPQVSSTNAILANQWVFVAVTCDVSGNTNVYWSILGKTVVLGLTVVARPFAPAQLCIGTDGAGPSGANYLNGDVATVKIWSGVVLTLAQLQAESMQSAPVQTEGLWDWWALPNDTTGLTSDTANLRVLTGNASHIANTDGPPLPTNFGSGICPF